ncbi:MULTISPECIES: glycosyltransferase [unclassified Acinetobacter]|uniref:glycosyltransferase n=1 Tax=unclassified Acinetobacter TaxID=196816 RepID=UPI0015D0DA84|nr:MULTISPECIES: glycosyltransferase [unclassified Acinetobacter]UUS65694.1 glycosyltransferase [Acinetobacter sp. YH12068_T]
MKILQVMATNGGMGGLEKHTLDLCRGLAQSHEVHLIADRSYQQKLSGHITLHPFDFSRSRWNPFLIYALVKQIKQLQPDVLHVQASKAASILAPWLKQFSCKKIVTVHGMKSNLKPFMAFDDIIAVSGKIKAKFPISKSVHVIWNGVDQDINQINNKVKCENQPTIALAIGRLETVKGFHILIDAWKNINAELWIVGDGTQYQSLKTQIDQLNLNDRVKLLGFRSDISDLLAQVDCFVISSLKEGGPITLAEALLSHVPTLSTDVGMVPDFIDGQFICEPNSSEQMANLISRELKPRAEMLPLFEAAFIKAEQNLKFESMLQQTENLYQN